MRIGAKYLPLIMIMCYLFSADIIVAQTPVELGTVNWLRSYDEAVAQSKQHNKPIFILFQEVPGCATCRNYGQNVMSNPLLVDAIENEFVPLAIYNNKGGADKKILDLFGEPTWNNPVVRIINSSGNDLTSRIAGNYSVAGVVEGMQSALTSSDRQVPQYLEILASEQSQESQTLYYSMYCFWSGEAAFGDTHGVLETQPGWMDGREVVKIVYDPTQVAQDELDQIADKNACKSIKHKDDYRIDKDPQYYLKQSAYASIPLSPLQRTRINSTIKNGGNPDQYLSPSQLLYLKQIKTDQSSPQLYDTQLDQAWKQMLALLR